MKSSERNVRLAGVDATQRPGYPLAVMFLAIAAAAVLLAMDAAAISSMQKSFGNPLAATLAGLGGGAIIGMFFGGLLGLFHHRAIGIPMGILSGTITGALLGPLCAAPDVSGKHLAVISLFGSALIVAMGALVRRGVGRRPLAPSAPWHAEVVAEVVPERER